MCAVSYMYSGMNLMQYVCTNNMAFPTFGEGIDLIEVYGGRNQSPFYVVLITPRASRGEVIVFGVGILCKCVDKSEWHLNNKLMM